MGEFGNQKNRVTVSLSDSSEPPFNSAGAVVAGDWVFLGGAMSIDWVNGIAAECRLPEDLPFSDYEIQRQTKHIFGQLSDLLAKAGTNLDNMVRIDQFVTDWDQARHYFPTRNLFLERERPASTLVAIRSLMVPGTEILVDGIAVVPHDGVVKQAINNPAAPEPKAGYSLAIRFGDWIWCSGSSPTDFTSTAAYPGGLGHSQPDGVWVDPNFAYDNAIKNQAAYCLYKLKLYLEEAGSDLDHVVKAQVYLTNCSDLPGLMQIWEETWGNNLPATTIVPIDRMMIGGSRCEINAVATTRGSSLERSTIRSDKVPELGYNIPQAVKVGPYIFLSGLMATSDGGIDKRAKSDGLVSPYLFSRGREEMIVILEKARAICQAAGGDLESAARIQLFSTDMEQLGAALAPWNSSFEQNPPVLSIIGVTGPHIVPSLAFAADIIGYAPEA